VGVAVLSTLLSAGSVGAAQPNEPPVTRPSSTTAAGPNVVVVVLDDVPMLDERLLRAMPNIRKSFLRQGVTFTDFHGETPTCCPGRAGFLTGQHTHNHGVVRNDARLLQPSMTLATALDDVGYHTILSGKYLNYYSLIAPTVPPGWDRFHAVDDEYYDYRVWSNGRAAKWYGDDPSDYSTDLIARKTAREIRRTSAELPLFAWISPYAAHLPRTPAARHVDDSRCADIPPWRPPDYMEADVSDKPEYIRRLGIQSPDGMDLRTICRTLLSVDDLVANVRQALAETGRLDDTLFVLTADNGMTFGSHRVLNDKKTPYATQIPFYVSWPARLGTQPRSVGQRLMNIDFAPTMCELAGCRLGPYPGGQEDPDGRSFADLLLKVGPGPKRPALLNVYLQDKGYVPMWRSVTSTRYSPLASSGCSSAEARGCRWLYVRYETGEKELYDLSNGPCWSWRPGDAGDPCALDNLAGDPGFADLQTSLAEHLARLRRERGGA
jgi:arylsulfatase A-like enzyme